MKLFGVEKEKAKKEFEKFMKESNDDVCLEYKERHRIADEEILRIIEDRYSVKKGCFHLLERQKKDRILKDLKVINGVTIRQLARVTGVSKYMVEKA